MEIKNTPIYLDDMGMDVIQESGWFDEQTFADVTVSSHRHRRATTIENIDSSSEQGARRWKNGITDNADLD